MRALGQFLKLQFLRAFLCLSWRFVGVRFRSDSILLSTDGVDAMATLTIKNIPADLYERLKESAAQDRRSINNQVIVCLERAFNSKIDADAVLAGARALRQKTSCYFLTENIKREG
jgi:plasmid stability protein